MFDKLLTLFKKNRDERGASAVEYGLLIAGIAALIVVVVFAIGPLLQNAFGDTCDEIAASQQAGACARQ